MLISLCEITSVAYFKVYQWNLFEKRKEAMWLEFHQRLWFQTHDSIAYLGKIVSVVRYDKV